MKAHRKTLVRAARDAGRARVDVETATVRAGLQFLLATTEVGRRALLAQLERREEHARQAAEAYETALTALEDAGHYEKSLLINLEIAGKLERAGRLAAEWTAGTAGIN